MCKGGVAMNDLKCPRWLSKEAKKEWNRIVPLLKNVCILDIAGLSVYCNAYAKWIKLEERLKNEPETLFDNKGWRYINPLFTVSGMYKKQMDNYIRKFKIPNKNKKDGGVNVS